MERSRIDSVRKRSGIFGAGQAGCMWKQWLPAGLEAVCMIDNAPALQGTAVEAIPVVSMERALEMQLDVICVAVLNCEAEKEIVDQLWKCGFSGEIRVISEFRSGQDIRLAALRMIAREINARGIPGAAAELGVYQGEFAAEINRAFPDRTLYLFDTFSGFDARDLQREPENRVPRMRFDDTAEDVVRGKLPFSERAVFCRGYFPDSLASVKSLPDAYAFVSLDPDLYLPVLNGLEYFYPRMSPGGVILIHDYTSRQFPGVGRAVREYCEVHGIYPVPLMDLHGSAVIVHP